MKMWQKILVAPGVGLLCLAAVGAMSYMVLQRQHSALNELFKTRFGNYQIAAASAQQVSEVHSNVYRLFTWIGNLKEDQVKRITVEQGAKLDAVMKKIGDHAKHEGLDPVVIKTAEEVVRKLVKYKKDVESAIDLSTVDVNTGMAAMQTADSTFQAALKDLNQLISAELGLAELSFGGADSAYGKMLIALLALLAVAIAITAAMTAVMTRMMVRSLRAAIATAQRIATGDLTADIKVKTRDEIGELFNAMKDMNANLARIVNDVRTGTDAISTASAEITAGNADLSQRTEEQASSLEETASSMEELTSTVKQNADNARQANQLAAGASSVAVKGGEVVGQVVQTMTSINESSKKIVDIIGVIDGIAFQTNILALNAAVEAARAGEQGRGFAVVASEVRSLAQRSAAAAKEIKDLITDSVGKVEDGTRLVDEAGKTMDEIVGAVKRVTDIMAEISAASQEQSSGIEQVNQAVTQMDEATQQNASLVEEAAAAAESLQEQVDRLARSVAVFKVAQNDDHHAAPRGATAKAEPVPARKTAPATAERQPRTSAKQADPQAVRKKVVNASHAAEGEWAAF